MAVVEIVILLFIHEVSSATDSTDSFHCPARCDVLKEADAIRADVQTLRQLLNQESLLRMTLKQKMERRKMFLEDAERANINSTVQGKGAEPGNNQDEISHLKMNLEQKIENLKKNLSAVNSTLLDKNEEIRSDMTRHSGSLEIKMMNMLGEMESKITTVNRTTRELISETNNLLQTTQGEVQQMTDVFNTAISKQRDNSVIAFTVSSTPNIKDHNHKVIVYDKVITNKGSAYNSTTGTFTCPTPGIYAFTWSTMSDSSAKVCDTFIYHNDVRLFRSYSYEANGSYNEVASTCNTILLSLTTGDRVWIQTDTCFFCFGYPFTGFSGWKL